VTHPDGLVIHTTDRGEGPIFERFFAGYDRAFVLADEKEDIEGFRACLALNHGAAHERLTMEYGPFRELCLVADDGEGRPVGGVNLIAMPSSAAPSFITANLNYIYIEPESRGRGHLARLAAAARRAATALFNTQACPVLLFIEQNDPFKMAEDDYVRDTDFTGLDQFDRLKIWARRGAMAIDFAYVQPALSADQAPDHNLLMSVLGANGTRLDAALLAGHLRSFFGISVLKGTPMRKDVCATGQLEALQNLASAHISIPLFDTASLLNRLATRDALVASIGRRPASMRDAFSCLENLTHRR